ncbi:holo-ACP synthase [Glaciecola sp. 1036]|uniref:holo-ACP synthase n=1 Tax=Alteromonadaceae TaxID=72275 RepID=UPI003CFF1934
MILGLGTDIVEIQRISKALSASEKLPLRLLTENEQQEYAQSKDKARYLAKKFAAKEALAKAMGTGIGRGIGWQHFEIGHDASGKPLVSLSQGAKQWSEEHKVTHIHISISDEVHYAIATAVIEA